MSIIAQCLLRGERLRDLQDIVGTLLCCTVWSKKGKGEVGEKEEGREERREGRKEGKEKAEK